MILDLIPCVVVTLLFGGFAGFIIGSERNRSPSEREQILETQIEALKRANHLGVAFFDAQAQMQQQVAAAQASRQRRVRR